MNDEYERHMEVMYERYIEYMERRLDEEREDSLIDELDRRDRMYGISNVGGREPKQVILIGGE